MMNVEEEGAEITTIDQTKEIVIKFISHIIDSVKNTFAVEEMSIGIWIEEVDMIHFREVLRLIVEINKWKTIVEAYG